MLAPVEGEPAAALSALDGKLASRCSASESPANSTMGTVREGRVREGRVREGRVREGTVREGTVTKELPWLQEQRVQWCASGRKVCLLIERLSL